MKYSQPFYDTYTFRITGVMSLYTQTDVRWGWRSLRRHYWCVLQIELSWPDWQTTCREPRTYYEGRAAPLSASVPQPSSNLQYRRVFNPYVDFALLHEIIQWPGAVKLQKSSSKSWTMGAQVTFEVWYKYDIQKYICYRLICMHD